MKTLGFWMFVVCAACGPVASKPPLVAGTADAGATPTISSTALADDGSLRIERRTP